MLTAWGAQGKKISPEDFRRISQGAARYDPTSSSVVPKPQSSQNTAVKQPMPTSNVPRPPIPTYKQTGTGIILPTSVPKPPAPTYKQIATGVIMPTNSVPKPSTQPSAPTPQNAYKPPSNSNYVAQGGQDLNDLLYLKREYEMNPNNKGLQNFAATSAKAIYGNLGDRASLFQGMNADQLETYIKGLGQQSGTAQTTQSQPVPTPTPVSDPGTFVAPTPTANPIPTPTQSIPALNMNQIGQYADSQIAAELARQKSAADQAINAGQLTTDQQLAALRQSAERLRGDITEQRNLENVQLERRLNPFNGRTGFERGMVERERGKTDRELTENQQMQEANILSNLAQLKNEINAKYTALQQTSGAERERIIQSLRDSERQYSMQEAQLEINRQLANSDINNTNFGQSLAQWQANRGAFEFDKNFGLQEGALTGDYQGQRTLAGQQFDEGVREYDQNFGYQQQRDQRGDFVSDRDFNEQVRQFGVDTALRQAGLEQDARQYASSQGLQWEQLNQRQKEFAAGEVWKQKNFDLEQSQLNQPGTEPLSPNELSTYVGLIENIPSVNAQINYVESLNLAQGDKDQLYSLLGLQKAGPPAPSGGNAMTDSEILQYLK